MLKKIFDFMQKHIFKSFTLIGLIAFINFGANLLSVFSNGNPSDPRIHELLATADGFQTVLIGLGMIFLQFKSQD